MLVAPLKLACSAMGTLTTDLTAVPAMEPPRTSYFQRSVVFCKFYQPSGIVVIDMNSHDLNQPV